MAADRNTARRIVTERLTDYYDRLLQVPAGSLASLWDDVEAKIAARPAGYNSLPHFPNSHRAAGDHSAVIAPFMKPSSALVRGASAS